MTQPCKCECECFPEEALVETTDGLKTMGELSKRDKVLVGIDGKGESVFESVTWGSRSSNHSAVFKAIVTEGGHVLALTANHKLPLFDVNQTDLVHIDMHEFAQPAENAKVGQYVVLKEIMPDAFQTDGYVCARITSVGEEHLKGVFSPLTASGHIVVNGVMASCYVIQGKHEEPEMIAVDESYRTGEKVASY